MKTRCFNCTKEVRYKNNNYKILVYGEMAEEKEIEGYYVVPIKYNGRTSKITKVDFDKKQEVAGYNQFYSRTKTFNMGWAICMTDTDKFALETGIKIAKRRFAKSPMKTQNGRFLTKDMCESIVKNEADYIARHIERYLVKGQDMQFSKDTCETIEKNVNKKYTLKDMVSEINKKLPEDEKIKMYAAANNDINDSKIREVDSSNMANTPQDGEYVMFDSRQFDTRESLYYLGIYKGTVKDYSTGFDLRKEFYFLSCFSRPTFDDKSYLNGDLFCDANTAMNLRRATLQQKRIIDDILRNKWKRTWDKDNKCFRIIVDNTEKA